MWKILSSKELFSHPRLTVMEDVVELPNGHKTTYLTYKDGGECSVSLICKNSEGKILVSKEYSHPIGLNLFQLPGGNIEANEDIEAGANRELMEETGYKANTLTLLGEHLCNNRRSTKKFYVYLATDLVKESLEGDPEESIENFWFSENEIENLIRKNEILNPNMLAAWMFYKVKNQ